MMLHVTYRTKIPYNPSFLQHAQFQSHFQFTDIHVQYKQETIRIRKTNHVFHVAFWRPIVQADTVLFPEHHHVLVDERTVAGLFALGFVIASSCARKRTVYALQDQVIYVDEIEEKRQVMQVISKTKPQQSILSKM